MRMLELLFWPLFPFLGFWMRARLGSASPRSRTAAVWAGALAGGIGWAADGTLRSLALGPWLATGAAWLAAAGYVLSRAGGDERIQRETAAALADLGKSVAALEREHANLRNELDKHERERGRAFHIYSLAKSLTEPLSWDSLITRFGDVLQKVTGSSDFLLFLPADSTGRLELRWQRGAWSVEALPETNSQKHPQWVSSGSETLLQVPLWQEESLLGLLWVRWMDASHPSVTDIAQIFEQLIIGFQKARLFDRMESLSRIDGLTGVLRRQTFLDHVEQEWNRGKLFKTPFSFLLVDVDHFKRVNDSYGHPAGDAVLSRMGRLLSEGVYETDFVGRYGGEEFGVLLPRAQAEGALRRAEALCGRVAAERFPIGFKEIQVTISIGVAHSPQDAGTVASLIEAADRALYAAKEGGRNRVVSFSSLPADLKEKPKTK
ncbi:MAG: GGDEF domain-containing protein [Elusimicrobia bacterium]|nr:GGDEF domain-containing protein [Elusimicrobiota bacterium]